MASSNCWRCLARPSQRLFAPTTTAGSSSTATFTTSAAQFAKNDGSPLSRHIRTGKKLILGRQKKRVYAGGKPLQPGERKAWRKRILLSNDNALEVPGLAELTAENMVNQGAVGQMMGIPDEVVDQLRAVEAFKPTQSWGLFRSPHVLVRQDTVNFIKGLKEAVDNKQTMRTVVTGKRSSGKSVLGLQALAAGFLNKWVVINIPEAQDVVSATTEYSTIPNSEQFSQPVYTVKLMQAIYAANKDILFQHKVRIDHIHLPISVPRSMSLAGLLTATKEPEFAWPVFQAFWKELILPGRPPVLFSLDGLSHIMKLSDYRSPAFKPIHSHDLTLVRLFVEALGGKTQFANGAAIVGVATKGNSLIIPSMDKAIEQAATKQAIAEQVAGSKSVTTIPPRDPFYSKYDERVFEALNGVRVFDVKAVSKTEARALMEYWAASGVLRMRVDEKSVSERWTLAGNGVVGEIERAALYAIRL